MPENPFYTRQGDEGYTGILGSGKIPKEDLRLEAIGSVDEANAALGVARSLASLPKPLDRFYRFNAICTV